MSSIVVCAGCTRPIEIDATASLWLRRPVWIDPEQVDGATDHPGNGTTCTDGDSHRPCECGG